MFGGVDNVPEWSLISMPGLISDWFTHDENEVRVFPCGYVLEDEVTPFLLKHGFCHDKHDGLAGLNVVHDHIHEICNVTNHYDVITWNHFPRYWSFVRRTTGQRWVPSQMAFNMGFDVFFAVCLNSGDLLTQTAAHLVLLWSPSRRYTAGSRTCPPERGAETSQRTDSLGYDAHCKWSGRHTGHLSKQQTGMDNGWICSWSYKGAVGV